MYNKKERKWVSDCQNETLLRWSNEPENRDTPEAKFVRASHLLTDISDGSQVAEAVALMESAAKEGTPEAMLAMGQLCDYGWAVHKSKTVALDWYRKAAEAGSKEAQRILQQRKRRKWIAIGVSAAAVAAVIGIVLAVFLVRDARTIKVSSDTTLIQVSTLDEYTAQIQNLFKTYDTPDVVAGKVSTNRLVLKYKGDGLDLRDFKADRIIARENKIVVLQFSDTAEANRCLEALKNHRQVIYVQFDTYSINAGSIDPAYSTLPNLTSTDPQGGCYSWGVLDMGLDQLSKYVAKYHKDNAPIVAIIDGGVMIHSEITDRVLLTENIITGGDVVPDAHGTHVMGTILDGTRSSGIQIAAYDVFNGAESCPLLACNLAMERAVALGARVINMSLGVDTPGYRDELSEQAIRDTVAAGVVFVQSAGNAADDTSLYCAKHIEETIIVAAHDIDHIPADFSNYGSSVDLIAPGVQISSYGIDGDLDQQKLNGTSMASPHVAAFAGLLRAIYPEATTAQIEQYIKESCRTYVNPELIATGQYGAGFPDATAFVERHPE